MTDKEARLNNDEWELLNDAINLLNDAMAELKGGNNA
jgi:hypothetical protein